MGRCDARRCDARSFALVDRYDARQRCHPIIRCRYPSRSPGSRGERTRGFGDPLRSGGQRADPRRDRRNLCCIGRDIVGRLQRHDLCDSRRNAFARRYRPAGAVDRPLASRRYLLPRPRHPNCFRSPSRLTKALRSRRRVSSAPAPYHWPNVLVSQRPSRRNDASISSSTRRQPMLRRRWRPCCANCALPRFRYRSWRGRKRSTKIAADALLQDIPMLVSPYGDVAVTRATGLFDLQGRAGMYMPFALLDRAADALCDFVQFARFCRAADAWLRVVHPVPARRISGPPRRIFGSARRLPLHQCRNKHARPDGSGRLNCADDPARVECLHAINWSSRRYRAWLSNPINGCGLRIYAAPSDDPDICPGSS